jgi:iron complex transport system substrate-binding protein
MKRVLTASGLAFILLVGMLGGSCSPTDAETVEANTIEVVDSVGSVIEIPQPLERVVILDHYAGEMVRALGAIDMIVGINDSMAEDTEYWPVLCKVPPAGSYSEPNYEKIVELNPQLLISCDIGAAETEAMLKPAGIPVVRLDFYYPETFVSDIQTLGLVLGKEDEAQELIDFYEYYFNMVQERTGALEEDEKATIYYESSSKDYASAVEGSGWHEAILMAGGINIFANEVTTGSPSACEISPEAILEKNPSAIWKNRAGSYIPTDETETEALYNSLISRPGWEDLDAVKNNRVIAINYWMSRGCCKLVTICYMAKLLYPDLFLDMDPEEVTREWLEGFQGVEYKGGYVYPSVETLWSN